MRRVARDVGDVDVEARRAAPDADRACSTRIALPVSSAACVSWRYWPCSRVYVAGAFAGADATPLPPAIAATGRIVTCVLSCGATISRKWLRLGDDWCSFGTRSRRCSSGPTRSSGRGASRSSPRSVRRRTGRCRTRRRGDRRRCGTPCRCRCRDVAASTLVTPGVMPAGQFVSMRAVAREEEDRDLAGRELSVGERRVRERLAVAARNARDLRRRRASALPRVDR